MAITDTNLKWYYSGGTGNTDPSASLGGDISTTEVGPDIHELFDRVSGAEALDGDIEYRCVFFQNTDADANGLIAPVVFIETNTTSTDTTIAIGLDGNGKNASAATIAGEGSAPGGVSFSAPSDYASGLSLPSEPYGETDYIGIWIRRTVSAGAGNTSSDATTIRVQGDTI